MRHLFACVLLLLTMTPWESATAGMCSSLDGQKYCACEYNQVCTAGQTSCSCSRSPGEALPRVVTPAPLSLPPPPEHAPLPRRSEPAPPSPPVPVPAPPDDDPRSPADFIRLAQSAIAAGRADAAVELIDKAQTRLLDRSVALNKTFDPITDEPIKQLSLAKQALQGRNRQQAGKSLDAALAAMR